MAPDDQTLIAPRTRLLIAGSVGVLLALLATIKIMLPTLGDLTQFPQFSPLLRAALLVKLLSPLLSFFLAAGWAWILLITGEWILSFGGDAAAGRLEEVPEQTHLVRHPHAPAMPSVSSLPQKSPSASPERLRQVAAPSLFQLDPTDPWQRAHLPMTPLPLVDPAWQAPEQTEEEAYKEEEEASGEAEQASLPPLEPSFSLQSVETASPESEEDEDEPSPSLQRGETASPESEEGENEPSLPSESQKERLSLQTPGAMSKPVTLTLLKQVRAWVQADDGTTVEVKLRGGESGIRLLLLAYIAWRKGELVDRDKLLTHVLARGKRQDMTTEQLGEVFDSAKRYLRQDLDRAVAELEKQGHPVSQEVDFFANEPGFYRLHTSCRVSDLDMIEERYRTIQRARKEGLLEEKVDGSIPQWVIDACQKLLDAYPGDFLQSLLERFTDEFGAWVREPFTLYRDQYLEALLIIANDESARGRNGDDEEQCRRHRARAAQLFYDYAMYAIKSVWDRKLKFAYRAGKDGERVIRAARAMRRCVVELGKLGQPDMIDQAYLAFKERMTTLSEGTWKPDRDTENDVAEAKKTTSAYRFASQIAVPQQTFSQK